MKIAILGYSGSGKSTLAKRLSNYYKIPVLFLDTVQFLPGWKERDKDEAREKVREFMQNDAWVIDGNYSDFLQKERLHSADRIIILCFPRRICLPRAVRRFIKNKNKTRESMAEGCKEKLDFEFIRWILFDGRTREKREHYRKIAEIYKEKTLLMKNQKEVDDYMKKVILGETQ